MKSPKQFQFHSALTATSVSVALFTHFAATTTAQAATYYWDGGTVNITANGNSASGGTAGTWNTTIQNWDNGVVPHIAWPNSTADTAAFAGTAGIVTVGTVSVGTLTVGTANYTFQTGTINFPAAGGNIDVNTVTGVTFSAALGGKITFKATGNTSVQGSNIATISGNNTGLTSFELSTSTTTNQLWLSSAGALGPNGATVKLTKGLVGLSGTGTTYNAWATEFAGGALRLRATGTSTYQGNGTLSANAEFGIVVAANLVYSGTLNLNANTLTLAPPASQSIALNGAVSGSGNLTVNSGALTGATGLGTVTLGTANPSFTGTASTTANKGTLALNDVNALQAATLATGASSGSQAVTFGVSGDNTYNIGALTGSDDLAIGANTISVGAKAVDTTFSAIISGTGGKLTKTGANKLTLAVSPTYDGLTTISAGTRLDFRRRAANARARAAGAQGCARAPGISRIGRDIHGASGCKVDTGSRHERDSVVQGERAGADGGKPCLLYTSPSPRD